MQLLDEVEFYFYITKFYVFQFKKISKIEIGRRGPLCDDHNETLENKLKSLVLSYIAHKYTYSQTTLMKNYYFLFLSGFEREFYSFHLYNTHGCVFVNVLTIILDGQKYVTHFIKKDNKHFL